MIWAKSEFITTFDHHIPTRRELMSNSNIIFCLKNHDGQEKNKPNRSYHNNDLSYPCSKKQNNYIGYYLLICVEYEYRKKRFGKNNNKKRTIRQKNHFL